MVALSVAPAARQDNLLAQQETSGLTRSSWEIAGVLGSTWLTGKPGPDVRSSASGSISFGVLRMVRSDLSLGVTLRGAIHPLTVSEAGEKWKPATLREASVLAGASHTVLQKGFLQLKGEVFAGGSVLTGAGDIMPFRVLPSLLPTGDVGIAISRSKFAVASDQPAGGPSLVIRFGAVKLKSLDGSIGMTEGWSSRIAIGIRSGY